MRPLTWGVLLVAAAACKHDPDPELAPDVGVIAASASAEPSAVPTAAPGCLPPAAQHGALRHVGIEKDQARLCWAERVDDGDSEADAPCVSVDLTRGSAMTAPPWPIGSDSPTPKPYVVSTTKDTVTICAQGGLGCASVAVLHRPVAAGNGGRLATPDAVVAAASDDGTRAFVLAPELAPGSTTAKVFGDTYEVKTGKRLFHSKVPTITDPKNAWSAAYFGSAVVLGDYACCDPDGATILFDPEKGTAKRLHGRAGAHGSVDADTLWTIDVKKLSLVDIASQRVIAGPFTAPGNPFRDPDRANADAVLVGAGDRLLFAYANPPGYVLVDLAGASSKASAPVALPVCAKP